MRVTEKLIWVLPLSLICVFAQGQEIPYEEQRFHEIYQQYHQEPMSAESWKTISGEKQGDIYDIQLGDTLWGVSQTMFGDGNYWPKVWALNRSISDPHTIDVGMSLHFTGGDENNAPSVLLNPGVTATPRSEKIQIPQPTKTYRPVVDKLPPSIPIPARSADPRFDRSGIALIGKPASKSRSAQMLLSSFLSENPPQVRGEVKEFLNRKMASLYDDIYVQMEDETQTGSVFTVINGKGQVIGGASVKAQGATSLDYQGEVRIEKLVNEEFNLYRAKVITQVNPVQIGARLIPGRIPRAEISARGRRVNTPAKVLGGEFDQGRRLLGVGAVLYLGLGADKGLRKGDIVPLIANERLKNDITLITRNERGIGHAKIVKVENSVSTGVIVYANDPIASGDFTGQGVFTELPKNVAAKFKKDTVIEEGEEEEYSDEEYEGDLDSGSEEEEGEFEEDDEEEDDEELE